MNDYRSSTLRCHPCDEDDTCEVCAFLAGDHSERILLYVIAVLDSRLAASESNFYRLLEAMRA